MTRSTTRRLGTAIVLGGVLALAGAVPTVAAKPVRGCADDFSRMSVLDFRTYLHSDAFLGSLPPEGQALAADILAIVDTDAWLDGASAYDKNGDGLLCLKQKTITPGHLYGWMFNAVDNTANS